MALSKEKTTSEWQEIGIYQKRQLEAMARMEAGLKQNFQLRCKEVMNANGFNINEIEDFIGNAYLDVNTNDPDRQKIIKELLKLRSMCKPRYAYVLLFLTAPIRHHFVEFEEFSERRSMKEINSIEDLLHSVHLDVSTPDVTSEMAKLSVSETTSKHKITIKTNSLLHTAFYGDISPVQGFLNTLEDNIEHGTLSFECKVTPYPIADQCVFTFSEIKYTFSLQQEEQLRKRQCKEMLKHFPVPLTEEKNFAHDHIIIPVKSLDDTKNALEFFENMSGLSEQAYVIFNGHGDASGPCLEEEQENDHTSMLKLFLDFKETMAGNTCYEGGPSVPCSIEFVMAQCYSHLIMVPEKTRINVTKLSKAPKMVTDNEYRWRYDHTLVDGKTLEVLHVELNDWATKTHEDQKKLQEEAEQKICEDVKKEQEQAEQTNISKKLNTTDTLQ